MSSVQACRYAGLMNSSGACALRCASIALASGLAARIATPLSGSEDDGGTPSYFDTLSLDASRRLPESAVDQGVPIHGVLSTGWRTRWNDGEARSDLAAYLGVDIGEAGRNPFSFHTRAAAAWNLNHSSDPSIFDGILDTYNSGYWTRLYDCYLDVHDVPELEVLRVGRQGDIETPVVAIYDGARVESKEQGDQAWLFGAYGGRSVRYYDSFDDGRALYGAYVGARPWTGGRMRVDWMHSEEESTFGGLRDDMVSVELWQRVQEVLNLGGFYSMLDGTNRDLRLDADWAFPEQSAQMRVRYYQLLEPQGIYVTEFDAFTQSLGVWEPYERFNVDASKSFNGQWSLRGGIDLRRLDSSDDAGEYNRDFDRYLLGASLDETDDQPYNVGVNADYWQGSGRDIWTWGLDAGRRLGTDTHAMLGTYYSLWKTDLAAGQESEDVRTYFVGVEHDVSDDLRLEGRFEFEDSSLLDFQILRLKATWNF